MNTTAIQSAESLFQVMRKTTLFLDCDEISVSVMSDYIRFHDKNTERTRRLKIKKTEYDKPNNTYNVLVLDDNKILWNYLFKINSDNSKTFSIVNNAGHSVPYLVQLINMIDQPKNKEDSL